MRRILLASDGSAYADEAAWLLAHLPHKDKLEITVLTVIVVPHTHHASLQTDWIPMCIDQDRARAAEAFAAIQDSFSGANVSLNHLVLEGHPGALIVEMAESLHSDLVVLGAKGKSAISRILLGSTSDYVATHAPCSVVVVRPTGLREPDHGLRAVVGYEDTDIAQAALKEIGEIPWGDEVEFHLVTVCYLPQLYGGPMIEEARKAAERAASQLRQVAPRTEVHLVENEHLGEALVQYAEDHHCDLFVVGETPQGALARILMGSCSRYVLRHAPCSVWIARSRSVQDRKRTPRQPTSDVAVIEHK